MYSEASLGDDKSKTGKPDRRLISITEPYELREWANKFGITEDALRGAIAQAGVQVRDVERYLKDKAKR